jgi:DNA-binding NarL/FixJ family response regulator
MLTSSDEEDDLFKALRAGASGYLLKDASLVTLGACLRTAVGGESALSPAMAAKPAVEFSDPRASLAPRLSERELEILRLVAEGQSNSQIAQLLYVSPHTIKRHVANVLAKLHLRTGSRLSCTPSVGTCWADNARAGPQRRSRPPSASGSTGGYLARRQVLVAWCHAP